VQMRKAAVVMFSALLLPQFMAAQALPQLKPFSADMEFTSNRGASAMHEMSGKVYVNQDHMRMDMNGGPAGGMVTITNFATKTTDMLMQAQRMYMEFNSDQGMTGRRPGMAPNIKPVADPNNPCAGDSGMTCKNLGVEEVNGRPCDHWQMTDKNGRVFNSWIDQKLHFPIKSVTPDTTWQLTNIKEGEPEASLFEVPAGYRKMDMSQMMQGMQGMHPPQQ